MKKSTIINLIRYHTENNEPGFRQAAHEIVREFDTVEDSQLAEYILALLNEVPTFVPQGWVVDPYFFEKVNIGDEPLLLPECMDQDILGIINAIGRDAGINKFLLQGPSGTGKTESVKQLARILNRDLYSVDYSTIISSKLCDTVQNISYLFNEMKHFTIPEGIIVLFDDIDSLILDKTNPNDIHKIARVTSTLLKEFDRLDDRVVLLATTNLFSYFDKALIRRFDFVIDFNRYTKEDLSEIAEILLNEFLNRFKCPNRNVRLFRKIISLIDPLPYPGDLKNLIRTAVAFSSPTIEFDYLRRLYKALFPKTSDLHALQDQGFTLREIETLTGISKSQVARELKAN